MCCSVGGCAGRCVPDCRLGGQCPNQLTCDQQSGVCLPGGTTTSSAGTTGSGSTTGAATTGGATTGGVDAGQPDAGSCQNSGDCAAPTAVCNGATGTCVECLADADCSGFSCNTADTACWQASCPYTEYTEPTNQVASTGCAVRVRDTSACRAAREAQGITGAWLKFSCRVTLTKVTLNGKAFVQLSTDNRPDYKSIYYGSGNACYETDTSLPHGPNPGSISAQSIVMAAPLAPTTSSGNMTVPGSGIGMAIDGVVLFSDYAAPGDDIYQEAQTFDRCQGHPQNTGVYHHHAEPFSITQDDDALVGVLRDGYFVYGRRDPDGSRPGEADGGLTTPYYGHVGTTIDSPTTPVFHYHVHYETNGTEHAYFITPQKYWGTLVGTCTNGAGGC